MDTLGAPESTLGRVAQAIGAITTVAALAGCDGGRVEPGRAAELLEPHRDSFASYDRWARRTLSAYAAMRDGDAVEETLFAPVRRQRQLLAVWVRRGDGSVRALRDPREMPEVNWAEVRDPQLGPIRVAITEVDDPYDREPRPVTSLVVSRTRQPKGEPEVQVAAAYRAHPD